MPMTLDRRLSFDPKATSCGEPSLFGEEDLQIDQFPPITFEDHPCYLYRTREAASETHPDVALQGFGQEHARSPKVFT